MALKKVSANSTEKFENEIGSTLAMATTKTTSKSSVKMHSSVKKGDDEVATISYDSDGGFMLVDLKKFKSLTTAEVKGILNAAAEDIVGEVNGAEAEETAE